MDYKSFLRPGNGAADITPLLNDANAFSSLIKDLAKLFKDTKVDKLACIEGKGFILGAPVAYVLKLALVPIRSSGKSKNSFYSESYTDYSGKEKTLELHQDAIKPNEKVIIVDDWVETGSTIKAAIKLIEKCGGLVVGIASFMDDSKVELRKELERYGYHYLEKVVPGDKF